MTVSAPTQATLIVGAGGLLGSALTTNLRTRGNHIVITRPVSWTTHRAGADLRASLGLLAEAVSRYDVPWQIAWCAGAGVTGTADQALAEEVTTFRQFLAEVATEPRLRSGTLFLASSAGGVYAGSPGAGPYDELAEPRPISAYGHAKLAGEQVARDFAAATGNLVLIGRIANLYGPNQDLAKAQGLISHLCRGYLTRQPTSIYVSLDTIRDYLFVDDCAAMIGDMLSDTGCSRPAPDEQVLIKVLASQQGTTIATLITVCRQVFKQRPRLVLGSSANARYQVRDLRLRSVTWPEIDRRTLTSLPAGIAATGAGMLRMAQAAKN